MGLKIHRPKRGSMAYYPRKRAESLVAKFSVWPDPHGGKPILLGFAAYKAGMAHVVMIDDRPTSPFYSKEIIRPVTILDAPPIKVIAFRAYTYDPWRNLKLSLGEVWMPNVPKDIARRISTLPEKFNKEEMMKRILDNVDVITEIRALVATQPRLSGIGKKTPELLEIPIGGVDDANQLIKYAESVLGKDINVTDVFSEGQYVDVAAITKGKGWQGVVKRFNVKILPKWHKHRKGYRRIGAIGPQNPALTFTTPRPGQMGLHKRTEYNKRILKIGLNGVEVTPSSGFPHYGIIKGQYIVLDGTVPGIVKRLVTLRFPVRPRPQTYPTGKIQIVWLSTQQLQGA
ncbi:50S ribosomal protein L3 [Vulcanisaeta souniana]|uniref:Large ribosomal subunit protein uL3 n=1 Tax=Vulcanisaeta souniana JCM 11219 TaxID=1293586 RepID=A0A830DZR1_9CREN|nr:50S ribosomal protein L3 [Vulcanisaeta souniana]BDR92036.1 50S ribosomal protein L3 [Vulcanisaeta souniana JCM 11219]GGI68411.1 50S ribosomal protein L3 [Vulcanisaeta souniana JCM 11219]